MFERAFSFAEFVQLYQLARSEGLVLRYLSDAYRAIRQTVPIEAQTDDLLDLIAWLGELVRQVDSSLRRRVGEPDQSRCRPVGSGRPSTAAVARA